MHFNALLAAQHLCRPPQSTVDIPLIDVHVLVLVFVPASPELPTKAREDVLSDCGILPLPVMKTLSSGALLAMGKNGASEAL